MPERLRRNLAGALNIHLSKGFGKWSNGFRTNPEIAGFYRDSQRRRACLIDISGLDIRGTGIVPDAYLRGGLAKW